MPHRIAPTIRFAGLPALAMLVLAGLLYWATTSLVSREFDAQSVVRIERRAELLAERFGLAVEARTREVEQLAHSASVVHREEWTSVRRELDWLKERVPAFVWIGFVTPDGVVRAATGQWLEGTSISERPVFVNGQRGLTVSDFHPAVALAPYLGKKGSVADIGVPVYGVDGLLRGVIAAHTSADWFIKLGERTVSDKETEKLGLDWFILRSDGTALNGSLPFDVPSNASGAFELRDRDGHLYAAMQRKVRAVVQGEDVLGWRALVVSRVDVANAPLEQFNRTFAIFAVLSTLACLAGGLVLARWAARPLDNFFSVVRKRFEAVGGPDAMPYNDYLGVLGDELSTALPVDAGPERDILLRLARDAQQLRRAFDHLPVAVAISTPEFRLQYVNQTYTRMLGWTTESVAGRRTAEFLFAPEESEVFQAQLRQLESPPGEFAARFDAVCADGSRRQVQWEMSPVLDRSGASIGVIVMIQDISGEMAAQRRALALSDRLRVFADSAVDYALVMLNSQGRVETWSRGATALMSLSDSHGAGVSLEALLSEGGAPLSAHLLQTAVTDGHAEVAAEFTREHHGSFFAEGSLYRLTEDGGRHSFALIVRDTTAQREAQRQLVESQSRLAAVIASASDAIVASDMAGRVTLFNPSAERIFGRPADEMLGQALDQLLPTEVRAGHTASLHSFAASGVSRRKMGAGRVFGLRANGERIELEASISQAEVAGETVLMAILRDVTERSRADKALVEYQLQLAGLTQLLLAQEKETTQLLAQSLHDDLGQTLGAMRLIFDAGMMSDKPQNPSAWLTRLSELITAANRQVRQVLTDLRPPLLDEQGLVAALDNEIRQRRILYPGVAIALYWGDVSSLRWPANVEYAAFMVTREAIHNALQHGRPKAIAVHVRGASRELVVSVKDDGLGMMAANGQAPSHKVGHLGLVGMRERSFAIGGTLDISSAINGGTTVTLRWEDADEPSLPD